MSFVSDLIVFRKNAPHLVLIQGLYSAQYHCLASRDACCCKSYWRMRRYWLLCGCPQTCTATSTPPALEARAAVGACITQALVLAVAAAPSLPTSTATAQMSWLSLEVRTVEMAISFWKIFYLMRMWKIVKHFTSFHSLDNNFCPAWCAVLEIASETSISLGRSYNSSHGG